MASSARPVVCANISLLTCHLSAPDVNLSVARPVAAEHTLSAATLPVADFSLPAAARLHPRPVAIPTRVVHRNCRQRCRSSDLGRSNIWNKLRPKSISVSTF